MPRLSVPLPSLLLLGDALALGLTVLFAPPQAVFGVTVPAGILAAVACELHARRERRARVNTEPWRVDGWAALVATLAVLGLGACVGPEASGTAWLLVALGAALGLASLPNLAPPPRA